MEIKNVSSGHFSLAPISIGIGNGGMSIKQQGRQKSPLLQSPKSIRIISFIAGKIGGIALLCAFLAFALTGCLGGLLDGQEAAVVSVPAPSPPLMHNPSPSKSPEPTPTDVATPDPESASTQFSQVSIADSIRLGGYDWIVLDVQESQALIITDRVIDHRLYHDEMVEVTWETSYMRQWLNGEFLSRFSQQE